MKILGIEITEENLINEVKKCIPYSTVLRMKVKGEKHSNSKVKVLQPIDMEKLTKIDKCVEEIVHNWRFDQALTAVFGPDYEQTIDRKKMSDYLKWVSTDTIKEESDIIASYGFEPKDVMGRVQNLAKKYFQEVENLK